MTHSADSPVREVTMYMHNFIRCLIVPRSAEERVPKLPTDSTPEVLEDLKQQYRREDFGLVWPMDVRTRPLDRLRSNLSISP